MATFHWPPNGGGGSGVAIYPTFGDFPPGTTPGELAIAADTGFLYEWNGSEWVLIGAPGIPIIIGPLDGQPPSVDGAVLTGNSLYMQSASDTFPGLVNIGTQVFAGDKTFLNIITGTTSGNTTYIANNHGVVVSSATNAMTVIPPDPATNKVLVSGGLGADPTWQTIGSGTVLTLIPVGNSPNANAATLTLTTFNLEPASALFPGVVTANLAQTFSGVKTFTSDIVIDTANIDINLAQAQGQTSYTTALVDGGIISVNTPTTFNLTAGHITYLDYSASAFNPIMKSVAFGPFTAQTVTGIAGADASYISIDNLGAIFQQTTYPTPQERRLRAFVAVIAHPNHTTILGVNNTPDFSVDINSQVYDFFDALGPFSITGNTIGSNGANLTFQRSAGTIFKRSANYLVTNQNPHIRSVTAAAPVSFNYATQVAILPAATTLVIPGNYDVGGVVTAVPGGANVSTIQSVYMTADGTQTFIQYGQNTYATLADALSAVGSEQNIVNPTLAANTILLGFIVLTRTATALNNPAQARFVLAGKFGNAIGTTGTTTLQVAYNNSISPEIVLNTTNGSLSINDASIPLGTDLFNVNDFSGATTFFKVNAAGITTTNIIDTALTPSQAVVTNATNQLISLAYAFPANGSTLVLRDPNGNASFNNVINNITVTVSANQIIALNAGSAQRQRVTGTANVQFNMPDATTLLSGWGFYINNASTGVVTVNQQDGVTLVVSLPAGAIALVVCTNNSTVQGTWSYSSLLTPGAFSGSAGTSFPGFVSANSVNLRGLTSGTISILPQAAAGTYNFNLPITVGNAGQVLTSQGGGATAMTWSDFGLNPSIQKFLSGSGTYTTPAGVRYLKVKMVGGGGGGSGSGTASASSNGGAGGVTTFGTTLLTANGGAGGTFAGAGGVGGTASLGTAIGTAITGGQGQGGSGQSISTLGIMGGSGAASPFGGAGGGGSDNTAGYAAAANTGSGGGGAATQGVAGMQAGRGGGAGGFIDAIIVGPLNATYAFQIGAAGTAGAAGPSGQPGGAGSLGYIVVEEY